MDPTSFTGWSSRLFADSITLIPPEGPDVGVIQVWERMRPLRAMRAIVDEALAKARVAGVTARLVASERFTTADAAHAAVASLVIEPPGVAPAERTLAVAYGDDFYVLVDAVCSKATWFSAFRTAARDLAHHAGLGLGSDRRRWFGYEPPRGWQVLDRDLIAEWYPPDYPKNGGRITVPPVRLLTAQPPYLERLLLDDTTRPGFVRESLRGPEPIESAHGLSGEIYTLRGHRAEEPPAVFDLAGFADDRYVYPLRLESDQEHYAANHELFMAVLRSCSPVPRAAGPSGKGAGVLDHWTM